ncbi:MAG: helix-turn-helix domain-containing protein [Wenzhouxiangella sp.]|nr:helix-turn-helix domain-containing protein [Wenzhouxiangella sp.]
MTEQFLNQVRLADRWQISPRTLERWRWSGEGPAFLKIGGRVVYRIADIEAYENGRRCDSTLQSTMLRGGR